MVDTNVNAFAMFIFYRVHLRRYFLFGHCPSVLSWMGMSMNGGLGGSWIAMYVTSA